MFFYISGYIKYYVYRGVSISSYDIMSLVKKNKPRSTNMLGTLMVLIALLIFNLLPNALSIIVFSGIFTVLIYKYDVLFKKAYILYIISLVLSVLSIVYYKETYVYYITKGIAGYGAFLVVMMVGVLPNKWTLSRKIKKYRGELSIIGFILISAHAILRIFGLLGWINLFGVAAYVIMIPLIFTSFKLIKKDNSSLMVSALIIAAYGIYVILFAHLLMVSSWENKIVYAVLLTLYVNNKLIKEFKK